MGYMGYSVNISQKGEKMFGRTEKQIEIKDSMALVTDIVLWPCSTQCHFEPIWGTFLKWSVTRTWLVKEHN